MIRNSMTLLFTLLLYVLTSLLALYRVRPGVRHGARKQYGPGDLVELKEHEAAGFLDKLERVPDPVEEDEPEEETNGLATTAVETEEGSLSTDEVDWPDFLTDEQMTSLTAAGYTPTSVQSAERDALEALDHIGKATARKLTE